MLKARRGFNLLELLIALTIFISVTVAMVAVWQTHARATAAAQDRLVGNAFAEMTMESQLARGWAAEDVPEETVTVTHLVDGVAVDAEYHRSSQVTDLGGGQLGLKQIVVLVWWELNGHRREVRITAMVGWQS